MRIALLQPQFAPNLYDMASLLKADRVIWNDLEQWHRKGRTHRAAIKGEQEQQWINIPVKTEDRKKPINQVRIEQEEDWIEPFWNALLHSYSEATWFDFFADELEADIKNFSTFEKLIDLDIWFFERLSGYMEFKVDYTLASQIPNFDPNPDVFLDVTGAEELYQEHDSKNYQWRSEKVQKALKSHPTYPQLGSDFLEELSILDLLFNLGKESYRVINTLK